MPPAELSFEKQKFQPDYAVPPGTTLREALSTLGMTQAELALRSGLSLKHVNQIVQGQAPITHETALAFEKVTGVSARFWNNLEVNFRDRVARLRETEINEEDIAWLRSLPISELVKRGLLASGNDKAKQLQEVCRFFGVATRETWERVWRSPLAAFRKSPTYQSDAPALATWLRLGELDAAKVDCQPFDPKRFKAVLQQIRLLTREDASHYSRQLVELCRTAGVAVVFVPEIKGCRASGAARWLTPSKAIIQLSLRHKTDDHFWFSFFHEAGHLIIHGKRETFITDGDRDDFAEDEANQFASLALIPKAYESELKNLRNPGEIRDFAQRIGLAPGIVVGRLQKEGLLPWSQGNGLKMHLTIVDDEEDKK